MEIEIDEEKLAAAINAMATGALKESLAGWEMQKTIGEVITREVAAGVIGEAIKEAVEQIDTAELVQHLAQEIQRATTSAVVTLLHEGLVSTVAKLRGIREYDGKEALARLRAELFGKDQG